MYSIEKTQINSRLFKILISDIVFLFINHDIIIFFYLTIKNAIKNAMVSNQLIYFDTTLNML